MFEKKIIISVVLIILFYSLFTIISNVQKIQENFSEINLIYIPMMISFLLLSMIIRSIFQSILLRTISIKLSLKINFQLFLSGLSMLLTPGGSGQIIKSQILKNKYNIPIKKSIPIIIAERFFDLVAVTLILIFSLFYYNSIETLIIISISIIIIISIILFTKSKKIFIKINLKLKKFTIFEKYLSDEEVFYKSLQKIFSLKIMMTGILFFIPIAFLDGLLVYFGFLAFGIDFGYIQTIQIYYSSLLAGVFSFIPGGFGIMESGLTFLIFDQGISFSLSSSVTLFVRLMTIWLATMIGFVAYFIFTRINKNK